MITRLVIYAFIVGACSGLVISAAIRWSHNLKLKMSWWKWLLSATWYALFLFCIFLDFTFMGEGEVSAGLKLLAVHVVMMALLGTGLVRILRVGRQP